MDNTIKVIGPKYHGVNRLGISVQGTEKFVRAANNLVAIMFFGRVDWAAPTPEKLPSDSPNVTTWMFRAKNTVLFQEELEKSVEKIKQELLNTI